MSSSHDKADRDEAALLRELEHLEWAPRDGVVRVLAVLEGRRPTAMLLELSMRWLGCYYQELDDVISTCRHLVAAGEIHRASSGLIVAIRGLEL